MALWGAVLGHGNLVYHAAGWQEGGLTASLEKRIIDVEMIQHMMAFLAPIEVNAGELALDALGRVPTGGHFFGEQHTLERYSTAFYQPLLSNWQNYEAWPRPAASMQRRARGPWKRLETCRAGMDPPCARRWRRRDQAQGAIGQGEP
jgi:trimethylamine--corrinoid protein Co-methyltransferase